MQLFSQARLLLVITVRDILTRLCNAMHYVPVPGCCALTRDIMRTARYGIVPTLHHGSQNLTLKSLAGQCTALKVVVRREES